MPSPTTYICTKCSFTHSDFSMWGNYSYVQVEERIPINRRIAICYSCDDVVSAEVLPDPARIKELEKRDGFILPSFIEDEKRRLNILKDRTTKARCLHCGSHDFEFIPYVESDKQQKVDNGIANQSFKKSFLQKLFCFWSYIIYKKKLSSINLIK